MATAAAGAATTAGAATAAAADAAADDQETAAAGSKEDTTIIVTGTRPFPYLQPDFWKAFRTTPAWEFARFAAIAETGKARENRPAPAKERAAGLEREDLESSIAWVKGKGLL